MIANEREGFELLAGFEEVARLGDQGRDDFHVGGRTRADGGLAALQARLERLDVSGLAVVEQQLIGSNQR